MPWATRLVRHILLAICLFAIVAQRGLTQTFGDISGRVVDASGASIGGANVTLTDESTSAVRTAVTSDSGDYSFPTVSPGRYSIAAGHAGFKLARSNNVQ